MHKKTRLAAALLSVVLALAACSSSKGSSKTTTNSSAANTSAASTGGSSASAGGDPFALAQQRVKDFTAASVPMQITEPVSVPKKGMTFAMLQCVQVVCKEIGDALEAASKAIGATLIRINHQDTPSTVQQAAVTALQKNPDAVFFSGDPTEWFAPQLAQMKAKNIPVISWSEPGGFQTPEISANLLNGDDYYFLGVLMADYVATKTQNKGETLLLNVPAYPVLDLAGQGYRNEMKTVCPDCKVTTVNFTVDDIIKGNVATQAVANLQRSPNVAYIVGTFGGLITDQLAKAVKAGGFTKVKAISASGTASNYQLIQQGDFQEADLALPSSYLGWRAVDVTLRIMAHKSIDQGSTKPASANIPGHPNIGAGGVQQKFVTKDDIPSGTVSSVDQLWAPTKDFQSEFKRLWGVS